MASSQRVELFSLRIYYFFTFVALGSLLPYLPLLLADRGMGATEISWVMVAIPVGGLVVPPLWGLAADAYGIRLRLLRFTTLACAITVGLLWPSLGLWGSLLAVGIFSIFRSPIIALTDAATYDILGGERVDFSKIRVWGSVGFVVGVFIIGTLGGSQQPALLLGATSAAYLLATAATLPLRSPPFRRERHVLGDTSRIIAQPAVVFFLIGTVFFSAGHATYDVYFGLHARSLGFGDAFLGTAWAIAVSVEVILMLLAPRFIHRVSSARMLVVCAAAATLRWSLIAVVTDPEALAGIQGLHGVSFGLWYLSVVKYIQAHAPAHLRTSLQSVALAAMGLGMVTGYLAGGVLFQHYGGAVLYGAAAGSAGIALTLYGFCSDQPGRSQS